MKTDLEIQQDVMEELKWEPFLNSAEIGVAVKNGIVNLSGTVDSYAKKIAAEKAAKRIEGVKAIAEEIVIKFSEDDLYRSDVEIAEAIINTLKWQSTADDSNIKIKVENGWVTLEGIVDWAFEKNKIIELVENLLGVRGITALINIASKVPVKEVKRKINAAFHRHASIDATNIIVETMGNQVILTGKVRSLEEKKDAEDAVWGAPGVTEVINNLIVEPKIVAVEQNN